MQGTVCGTVWYGNSLVREGETAVSHSTTMYHTPYGGGKVSVLLKTQPFASCANSLLCLYQLVQLGDELGRPGRLGEEHRTSKTTFHHTVSRKPKHTLYRSSECLHRLCSTWTSYLAIYKAVEGHSSCPDVHSLAFVLLG